MNKMEFNITKLKGSANFHTWKFAMKNFLEMNDLVGCITPSDDDVQKPREAKADKISQAKTRIILSMDESLYIHVENCDSAFEIWKKLEDLFEDRGWMRKIGLLRQIMSIKLENCENMHSYIENITGTANKLNSIGFKITDDWLGAIMLAGLTDIYRPLIMSLEGSAATISADLIKMKLLDMQYGSNSNSDNAFTVKVEKNKFPKGKNKNQVKKCYTCNKRGHISSECWNKKKNFEKKGESKSDPKKISVHFLQQVIYIQTNGI